MLPIDILGYSHTGKKGVVTKLIGTEQGWVEKYSWKIRGNVLKKDGTQGINSFDFDEYHYTSYIENQGK